MRSKYLDGMRKVQYCIRRGPLNVDLWGRRTRIRRDRREAYLWFLVCSKQEKDWQGVNGGFAVSSLLQIGEGA